MDEPLEALKARFCRLSWASSDEVPPAAIEGGLQHLEVLASGGSAGAGEAVVSGFSEVGFGRFRREAPVEVTRVDSLSLEEIFIALCGENGGRP